MREFNKWHRALAFAFGRKVISGDQLAQILRIYRENYDQGELEL